MFIVIIVFILCLYMYDETKGVKTEKKMTPEDRSKAYKIYLKYIKTKPK